MTIKKLIPIFVICAISVVAVAWGFLMFADMAGYHINPDSRVVIDRTVTPAAHALDGMLLLPSGAGMYNVHAMTLSKGEAVRIGFHYRIANGVSDDRFNTPLYKECGSSFITDDNTIVNETIIVPEGAIDAIITVSYVYYSDTNKVHIIVKKVAP